MARSVRAQVMQTGEVNKVLIKRVPSSRFAFHSCTELVIMMAAWKHCCTQVMQTEMWITKVSSILRGELQAVSPSGKNPCDT